MTTRTVKVTHAQKLELLRTRLEKPGAPRILVESRAVPGQSAQARTPKNK